MPHPIDWNDLGPDFELLQTLAPSTALVADRFGHRLVLKPLGEDCLLQEQIHPLILRRLKLLRELPHAGLAHLVDVVETPAGPCLMWQWVDGADWKQAIAEADRAGRRELCSELLLAIESLHALGVVHGALRPGNVLVRPQATGWSGSGKAWTLVLTHVSPLLHHDPDVDITAAAEMVSAAMGAPPGAARSTDAASEQPPADSIAELHRRLSLADITDAVLESDTDRRGVSAAVLIVAVLAIGAVAVALAWTLYRLAL